MRIPLPKLTGDKLRDAVNRARWSLGSTHLANGVRYDAFQEAQHKRITRAQAVLKRAEARLIRATIRIMRRD